MGSTVRRRPNRSRCRSSRNAAPKRASTITSPADRTPRVGSEMSVISWRARSSSWSAIGAIAMQTRPELSTNPTARISPSRRQTRRVSANASAPKCQCQPKSPGCNCTGAASCCQLASAWTTSARESAFVLSTLLDTRRSNRRQRCPAPAFLRPRPGTPAPRPRGNSTRPRSPIGNRDRFFFGPPGRRVILGA